MSTNPYPVRLTETDKEKVELVAQTLGYIYGSKGSVSQLLKAIADGDLLLSQKNP